MKTFIAQPMAVLLLAGVILLTSACRHNDSDAGTDDSQQEDVFIQSIEFVPDSVSLVCEQSIRLQAMGYFSDGSSRDITENALWDSLNESIATVSNTAGDQGRVVGVSQGQTTIRASWEGMSGQVILTVTRVNQDPMESTARIIFLHRSTGYRILAGGVAGIFQTYNTRNGTEYFFEDRPFPNSDPRGLNDNYPYNYWNAWVNHSGDQPLWNEPTLEMLTRGYDVVVWKHCYPVSDILPDTGTGDIGSDIKRVENYKLQYEALKMKMRQFPQTRFVVWTGAARVQLKTTQEQAERARVFFHWVKTVWDEPGDNIFIWDFFELETEGGLYLKDEYATSPIDSHPDAEFSSMVAPYLCNRIVDVIEGRGDISSMTGK